MEGWAAPLPLQSLIMLTRKDISGGSKIYKSLPAEEKHKINCQVDRMIKDAEMHEAKKENDVRGKLKDLSHEVAGYCDRVIVKGAITTIGGIGNGKKRVCSICSERDSVMSFMPDSNWYCQKHKSSWDSNKKQKELIKC